MAAGVHTLSPLCPARLSWRQLKPLLLVRCHADSKALDGVDLIVPAGKLTALVGLSGSGERGSRGRVGRATELHATLEPLRSDRLSPTLLSVPLPGLLCAGKSTLVSLIQRLYDPTAGAVLLDGTDLRRAWEGTAFSRLFNTLILGCCLPPSDAARVALQMRVATRMESCLQATTNQRQTI